MAETTDSTLSRDMLVGTPQYISPEQARGEKLDARTDIYSLGVVLFEMLAGKVPYDADTPYAVIHDHIFSPLPLPSEFNRDIPEDVERVVLKALAKDRSDRFQDVREMISTLEASLGEEAIALGDRDAVAEEAGGGVPEGGELTAAAAQGFLPEGEPPEGESTEKPRRRWRRLVAIVAVVGSLFALCLCGSVLVASRGGRQRGEALPTQTATVAPLREDPGAHILLARRYLQQGNVEGAIAEYEAALRLAPDLVEAYVDLGNVYLREGDTDLALETFQGALEVEPDQVKAHLGMGDAYLVNGELAPAAYHYQIAVDQEGEVPGPHAKLGTCFVLQGELELGREECELALRMDLRSPEGHFCRGLFFAQQGDTDEASREFQIVVDTAPGWLAEQARRQLDRLE